MFWTLIFWLGLVVSVVIGAAYFRDLGDVSQMVLKVKRANMIRFIRNEYRVVGAGLGASGLWRRPRLVVLAGAGGDHLSLWLHLGVGTSWAAAPDRQRKILQY